MDRTGRIQLSGCGRIFSAAVTARANTGLALAPLLSIVLHFRGRQRPFLEILLPLAHTLVTT